MTLAVKICKVTASEGRGVEMITELNFLCYNMYNFRQNNEENAQKIDNVIN